MHRYIRFPKLAVVVLTALVGACSADLPTAIPAGGVVTFDKISGDRQWAYGGAELPAPLVVMALDAAGKPVKGQLVNFVVVDGGGSVFAPSVITNEKGIAQNYWSIGGTGDQKMEVRAVDPSTGRKMTYATFTAYIAPPE